MSFKFIGSLCNPPLTTCLCLTGNRQLILRLISSDQYGWEAWIHGIVSVCSHDSFPVYRSPVQTAANVALFDLTSGGFSKQYAEQGGPQASHGHVLVQHSYGACQWAFDEKIERLKVIPADKTALAGGVSCQ